MILHCNFGIVSISDKALERKSHDSSKIASMSIDLVAILTNSMYEMNQIRRDSMNPKLGNLDKLVNDVPPSAPLPFGSEEDMNKRVTKIMANNSAMVRSMRGKLPKNFKSPPILLPLWDEGLEREEIQGKTILEKITMGTTRSYCK